METHHNNKQSGKKPSEEREREREYITNDLQLVLNLCAKMSKMLSEQWLQFFFFDSFLFSSTVFLVRKDVLLHVNVVDSIKKNQLFLLILVMKVIHINL